MRPLTAFLRATDLDELLRARSSITTLEQDEISTIQSVLQE